MKVGVFGVSGFAREVADICEAVGYKKIVLIGEAEKECTFLGYQVLGENEINNLIDQEYAFAIGVGEPLTRKKIQERFQELKFINLIHPSATFGNHQLRHLFERRGNIVCAGARLTNNISVGNFGVYNLNCTVGHDCIIEDFVTIAPGANISGNVHLGKCCYIGTNASIRQGESISKKLVIGDNSTVGAGAVVIKDVANGIVVKGIPAK